MFDWMTKNEISIQQLKGADGKPSGNVEVSIEHKQDLIAFLLGLITLIKIIEIYMFYKKSMKKKVQQKEMWKQRAAENNA